MSDLENELEQKGEQELKKKLDNELGGSSGGGQPGSGQSGDQQAGDPNTTQDPGADEGNQSQT